MSAAAVSEISPQGIIDVSKYLSYEAINRLLLQVSSAPTFDVNHI